MNADMKQRVIYAIRQTFSTIAGDLEEAREWDGESDPMTLGEAVECTLDADRVRAHGGDKEAADALYALESWNEMKAYGDEALRVYF